MILPQTCLHDVYGFTEKYISYSLGNSETNCDPNTVMIKAPEEGPWCARTLSTLCLMLIVHLSNNVIPRNILWVPKRNERYMQSMVMDKLLLYKMNSFYSFYPS